MTIGVYYIKPPAHWIPVDEADFSEWLGAYAPNYLRSNRGNGSLYFLVHTQYRQSPTYFAMHMVYTRRPTVHHCYVDPKYWTPNVA